MSVLREKGKYLLLGAGNFRAPRVFGFPAEMNLSVRILG